MPLKEGSIDMILSGSMNVLVYKKKALEFEQGNQKMEYYRVIIDVNDEVDELPCSKEVFDSVQAGKMNLLTWTYNTKADRNPFKFTRLGLSDSEKPSGR